MSSDDEAMPILTRGPVPARNGRLSVVETVSHQLPGRQPVSSVVRFCRTLLTDEQPFIRHGKVREEWMPIETGWVRTASLLVLENTEGKLLQTVPTDEEREETARRVVEIALRDGTITHPVAKVLPGQSARFCPVDITKLWIRCASGEARFTLTLIPE